VKDVTPGYYEPLIKKSDEGSWGARVSMLMCIHEDYIGKEDEIDLNWVKHAGTVGVDSGQAGIFSKESYRNDSHSIEKGEADFSCTRGDEGDEWYDKMCQRTLDVLQWGSYDEGVVSTSGFGDGSYTLYVLTDDENMVVGFCIDFGIEEDEIIDFEFYKDTANF
jgi:hypothetical protein